jgi:hypothetical protein
VPKVFEFNVRRADEVSASIPARQEKRKRSFKKQKQQVKYSIKTYHEKSLYETQMIDQPLG